MFLQVADAAVDDCADGGGVLGAGGHEAAVDGVDGVGGGGDEEDGVGWDCIDLLISGQTSTTRIEERASTTEKMTEERFIM